MNDLHYLRHMAPAMESQAQRGCLGLTDSTPVVRDSCTGHRMRACYNVDWTENSNEEKATLLELPEYAIPRRGNDLHLPLTSFSWQVGAALEE